MTGDELHDAAIARRGRLVELLEQLDEEQWNAASRCARCGSDSGSRTVRRPGRRRNRAPSGLSIEPGTAFADLLGDGFTGLANDNGIEVELTVVRCGSGRDPGGP